MENIKIIDTNSDNILKYGICGYKSIKKPGFPEKVEWLKQRLKEGMRIKTLYSETGGTQGMIEYIPGEYCWRPVDAAGYMFIHCLWTNGKKYRGQLKNSIPDGLGTLTFPDGRKYVGQFVRGKMHGQGTLTDAGGQETTGLFKNNAYVGN